MLSRRRKLWNNIKPPLDYRVVFAFNPIYKPGKHSTLGQFWLDVGALANCLVYAGRAKYRD